MVDLLLASLFCRGGLPGGSVGKNSAHSAGDPRSTGGLGAVPELGRSPGGGNRSHSSVLAWESHGQGSLEGYSPCGRKESDTTERLSHDLCPVLPLYLYILALLLITVAL